VFHEEYCRKHPFRPQEMKTLLQNYKFYKQWNFEASAEAIGKKARE
jgi:hypothetical protein